MRRQHWASLAWPLSALLQVPCLAGARVLLSITWGSNPAAASAAVLSIQREDPGPWTSTEGVNDCEQASEAFSREWRRQGRCLLWDKELCGLFEGQPK